MVWTIPVQKQRRRMVLLNKDHFFDEELEEIEFERMEKALGEDVISPMREELDRGWNEVDLQKKKDKIFDSNYGIIERSLLLE